MQPNEINLTVDLTNSGSPVTKAYARYDQVGNRSTYIGEGHSTDSRNLLQFYRTEPKRNGESRGVMKGALKFTIDRSVPNASGTGNIVSPQIIEVSIANPVGVTPAQTLEAFQYAVALLDDDTIAAPFRDTQEI